MRAVKYLRGMAGKGGAIQRKDDDFEARYMPAEGNVLHRDKRISRGIIALLGGTGLGIVALAVAITGEISSGCVA